MINLVQAQNDLTGILLSAPSLRTVNVRSYREMRIKQELDYKTLLTTPRNGKAGAGVLVLMPDADDNNPGVSGPILSWSFGIVVLEMDAINLNAQTGTLLNAEAIVQEVMDVLHLEADERLGTFNVGKRAVQKETEYVFPGCIGYRVNLMLSSGRSVQTARVSQLQCFIDTVAVTLLSAPAGELTITTATAGARIRYTLDGTFPADINGGNPNALDYDPTDPPTVNSEDTVRVAAYLEGFNKSATRYFEIS